jgi:hypothetical protein
MPGRPANGAPSGEGGAPPSVRDLAEACVRFVERAVHVRLDYEPETLSLLDHYLEQARRATPERPEALSLVAHAAGAYFGEVVRRRHASWWRTSGDDPTYWQVELESVYLAFSPVELMHQALALPEPAGEADGSGLELMDEDREAVAARLAELPPVSIEEYFAPTTRLEVIDIAVEAIRARKMAAGENVDEALGPDDYEEG